MTLRGHVEDLGIPEILHVVGISHRSGLLLVDSRGKEYRLLFRAGGIVAGRAGKEPATLAEFLERRGIVDATHFAVLERQARKEERSVLDLLDAEGRLTKRKLQDEIETELLSFIDSMLALREGEFEFSLLEAPENLREDFGGLLLAEGLAPTRIPAVAERSRPGGLRLGGALSVNRGDGRRQARLLVAEDEISLPALRSPSGPAPRTYQPPRVSSRPAPQATTRTAVGSVLCVLSSSPLATAIREALEGDGLHVEWAADLPSAREALARLDAKPAPFLVVAQASHPAAPGLEVLSRTKHQRRDAPVLLLVDPGAARVAGMTERAGRLGATHVMVVPETDPAFTDNASAGRLVADLAAQALAPQDGSAPAAVPLPAAPAGPEGLLPDLAAPPRLSRTSPRQQATALAAVARGLEGMTDLAQVSAVILEQAGEYFSRAVLLARVGRLLVPLGTCYPAGAPPLAPDLGRRLRTPAGGEDEVARTIRLARGSAGRVAEGSRDVAFLRMLGGELPRHVALLPLSGPEGCFAVVHGDDYGANEVLGDLSALTGFLAEAGPVLHAALALAEKRAEVRRLRRAS